MARESQAQVVASLRALTYRITSCPPKQLPHIAPQIAASLWNCRSVLSIPSEFLKARSDANQTVNRFRTSVTQLLQARGIEERWAAVVLAKAAIEAGGLEIVGKATGWTKNLIAILKKNDPPNTKVLALIALTRVFMLTWEDANVVREITTPALPGFVQACLTAAERQEAASNVLQTVLEAFATLIPRHPTIFRTYEAQIRSLLLKILATTPSASDSEMHYTQAHHEAAGRLFVLLHHCAPKQGGTEKWAETFAAVVAATHATCDRVFRSVNESWKSNAGIARTVVGMSGEPHLQGVDAVGLRAWHGIHAGTERVVTLLQVLRSAILCGTSGAIPLRLGSLMDLVKRLLELDTSIRDDSAYFNAQISKDERETMLSVLSEIHVAALGLCRTMIERFGNVMVSALPSIIESLSAVFAAECGHDDLRTASYEIVSAIIDRIGPTLPEHSIADISLIIRSCCEDLLPATKSLDRTPPPHSTANGASSTDAARRAYSYPATLSDLHTAASDILPVLFTKIDQSLLPAKLRNRMEQTAVLTRHKDALVACVLNLPSKARGTALRPSLLPLLAKEFPGCAEVEALLRPRFPVAGTSSGGKAGLEDVVEEDDGSSEEESDDEESDDEESDDEEEVANGADEVAGNEEAETLEPTHGPQSIGTDTAMEEVFSTAPEQIPELSELPQSNKRPATEPKLSGENSAKRLRSSPVASALAPGLASILPGPDAADVVSSDVPMTVFATGDADSEVATVPSQPETISRGAGEVDSDDEDFEIPPLTMDSDSELEDLEDGDGHGDHGVEV